MSDPLDPNKARQMADLLGVDEVRIVNLSPYSKRITLTCRDEHMSSTFDTDDYASPKAWVEAMSRVCFDLARALKHKIEVEARRASVLSAQSFVMNGIMSVQEVRAQEFRQLKPMEPLPRMVPVKLPANRFEAIIEELKGDEK